ncbi:MAG TPA: BTAD domain-containing putative transcriptional regulator [Acidimicrobiales bacterium]|nr:BTAD domain-containing putative transcriptional regulator [Acidimicrobiales bacterium]
MQFRILGPVEAVVDGQAVELGAPQLRALLARLLLTPNTVVPADVLLDALWGDSDDANVRNLRVYVSRLRKALDGTPTLRTQAPGYVLDVSPDQVDAHRFEQLVSEGRRLLGAGEAAEAGDALREALALWRGPALADQRDRAFALPDAVRLDEARLDALEERIEADLACGGHAALVAELRGLVGAHPMRERLWRQRMLAEYRSGQAAEALRTFQELRRLMVDELGLDPSAEVCRLERAVLDQDPALDLAASPRSPALVSPALATSDADAVRVLLVDDHPMWRAAVRNAVERDPSMRVVAEAEDGEAAVTAASEASPDVVLMDLHLPRLTGAEATAQIVAASPTTRVLMLSASGEEADVLDAVKAGAVGYLLKSGDGAEIVDAIGRVSRGEPVFTPSLAGVVLDRLRSDEDCATGRVNLSVGQRELLRMLAGGATVDEAATALALAEVDVRADLTTIVERLQAAGRDGPVTRRLQTVLFVDVVDSTAHLAGSGDRAWRAILTEFHAVMDRAAAAVGGRVIKHNGDGALLTFEQPRAAIDCAKALVDAVVELSIEIRAGLHMGECEVADDDVYGMAVHIAARIVDEAAPNEVLVSQTMCDLVMGSDLRFEDRGVRVLKGVPGEWRLYAASV